MAIKFEELATESFDAYYEVFKNTLLTLFPEYSPSTLQYFIDVDYEREWMKSVLMNGNKKAFIAMSDDQIVGYIFSNKVYGGVSMASWIAVLPEYQKLGIASRLLTLWEEDSLKNGAHSLQLWTTAKRVSFYEKRGFQLMGTFPQAWFGKDMPMMYKSLRKPVEENYLKDYLGNKK